LEKRESLNAIKSELDDVVFAVRKFYREGHWYANIGHWSGNADRNMFHDGARLCRLNVKTAAEGTGMIYGKLTTQKESYRWFSMGENWPQRLKAARDVVESRCTTCHDGKKRPLVMDLDITREQSRPQGKRMMSNHTRVNLTRPDKSLLLLMPLSKEAGGLDGCGRANKPRTPVFSDKNDPAYQTMLAYIKELHLAQDRNKRFNMEGFKPNEHYVRELKRYGIIPENFDRNRDSIDVYQTDRAYWDAVRWKP